MMISHTCVLWVMLHAPSLPSDILQDQSVLDPSTSSSWDWSDVPGLTLRDTRALEHTDASAGYRLRGDMAVAGGNSTRDIRGFLRTQAQTPWLHIALVLGRDEHTRMVWDLSRGAVLVRDDTQAWGLNKAFVFATWKRARFMLGSFTARTQGGLVFASQRRYGDDEMLAPDDQTRMLPRTGDVYLRRSQWGLGMAWEPLEGLHGAIFGSFVSVAMSQYAWQGGVDAWSTSDDAKRPVFLNANDPNASVAWQTTASGMGEALLGGETGWRLGKNKTKRWINASGYVAQRILNRELKLTPTANAGFPNRDVYGAWGFGAGVDQNAWHGRATFALTDSMAPAWLLEGRYDVPGWEWGGHVRYYSRDYDNPHTVAPASPSQMLGIRARNEMGVRSWFEFRRGFQTRVVADVSMAPKRVAGDAEPLRWRVDIRAGRHSNGSGVRGELYTGGQMLIASPALQHGLALRSDVRHGSFQGSLRAFMILEQVLGKAPAWPYGASVAMVVRCVEQLSLRVLGDIRHESSSNRVRGLMEMIATWRSLESRIIVAVARNFNENDIVWNLLASSNVQF